MAQQNINFGAYLGDITADKTRDAFIKVQANFTELYAGGGGLLGKSYLLQEDGVSRVLLEDGSGFVLLES